MSSSARANAGLPAGSKPEPSPLLPAMVVLYTMSAMLTTDLYLPGLPLLTQVFGTSEAAVQLSLTLFLAGFAAGHFFYGPLSDRVGRRPVLLLGGLVFVAATLACAAAPGILTFNLARLAQGLAVASLTVTILAAFRELYDDERFTRLGAIIGMAEALAPAFGPILGAEILERFGWRWNFLLAACFAAAGLAGLFLTLPESNLSPNRQALHLRPMAATFARLLATRKFLGPVAAAGLVYAGFMVYLTAAPFLLIDRLGLSPRAFSMTQIAVVGAYIAGQFGTTSLVGRIGPDRLIRIGFLAIAAGGALMLAPALGAIGPWAGGGSVAGTVGIVAPFCVFAAGIGLTMAPLTTRAMSADPSATGSVAALLGAVTIGLGFAGSLLGGVIYDGTGLSLAAPVAGLGIAALVVYRGATRGAAPQPQSA